MSRALILGGTGALGAATARRLLAAGWQVDVTGRDPGRMPADVAAAGGRFVPADRRDIAAQAGALGGGADLLLDCVCFTAADARLLLPLAAACASTVMVSSKAVYVDAAGNHSNSDVAPRFDGPVAETQPTLAPASGDHPGRAGSASTRSGYGPNKVAAEQVLLDSGLPVTVLRPSKVHGVGASPPREWVFVRRALDRRRHVVLAHQGAGVDHPSAAANVAALVEVVAASPGARVLNVADPDAPSGLEITRTVAARLGHVFEEVLLDGPPVGKVGRHPWDRPHPVVLDTSAARTLGWVPVGDYASTVADELDWLVRTARDGTLRLDEDWFAPMLDYAAEDRYHAGRAASEG